MQNMIKIPTTTLRVKEEWRRNCTIRSDAPPSSESITSSLVGREVKALGKTLNETVIPRKVLE